MNDEKNPFIVDDLVRVNLDAPANDCNRIHFAEAMKKYRGTEHKIIEVSRYSVKLKGCEGWNFDYRWLTLVSGKVEVVVSEDEFEKLFNE